MNSVRTVVQDAALAAFLVAAGAGGDHATLWWAATGLAGAAVALRRRRPFPMLALVCAAAVLHLAGSVPLTIVDLSVPILLYTVAARHGWALSLLGLSGALVLAVASSSFAVGRTERVPPPPPPPLPAPVGFEAPADDWTIAWDDLPGIALLLIAAWAIGSATRSRRAYVAEQRARADDLERERGQQAVLAVTAERGRISRELHDVVAHGLSVMVVQAQGGAAALDNRPADTRAALDAIIRTGRESLADMRRVLATVGDVDDAWHPQRGLGVLPGLLDEVRAAGTPVRLSVDGTPVTLPSAVDLAAYRIVQEALTNVRKHAGGGARAEVVITYAAGGIVIEVSDDGAGCRPGDGRGQGLRGMRERVRVLGGRLDAGPSAGAGFVVRARLPLPEVRP